eukprot:gene17729-21139_t
MTNDLNIDQWADNIEDIEDKAFPSSPVSCSIGHPLNTITTSHLSPLKGEYYNFNFRMGTPITGKDFYTPTYTHG